MRILQLVHHSDSVELDVQVLVDTLECAADRNVVLELDRDLGVHQCLEEAARSGSVMYQERRTRPEAVAGGQKWATGG